MHNDRGWIFLITERVFAKDDEQIHEQQQHTHYKQRNKKRNQNSWIK